MRKRFHDYTCIELVYVCFAYFGAKLYNVQQSMSQSASGCVVNGLGAMAAV